MVNETPTATTLHWHGLNTMADVDGASTKVLFGRDTDLGPVLRLEFPTIHNNSTLLWVHAHPMFYEAPLIYGGLYGMVQVVDEASEFAMRGFEYGDNYLPLAYQDADFHEDGTSNPSNLVIDEQRGTFGVLNGVSCINWTGNPEGDVYVDELEHQTTSNLVRIDLLNATQSFRYLNVGITDCHDEIRDFYVVQNDTGFQNPTRLQMITMSAAQRIGLLFDLNEFEGGEARLVLFNFDLSSVGNLEVGPGGLLAAQVPDLSKTRNPTPNPTPIPSPLPPGKTGESTLTFPKVAEIPTVLETLENGNQRLPLRGDLVTTKRLLTVKLVRSKEPRSGSGGKPETSKKGRLLSTTTTRATLNNVIETVTLKQVVRRIREVVFGRRNYQKHKSLIKTPNFEYLPKEDYFDLLNPKYFYNLPLSGPRVPLRNLMFFADDIENTNLPGGNPQGFTEAINDAQRVVFDLWNSDELHLGRALKEYQARPNDYRPDVLPTVLFQIFPSCDGSGNDTYQGHMVAHQPTQEAEVGRALETSETHKRSSTGSTGSTDSSDSQQDEQKEQVYMSEGQNVKCTITSMMIANDTLTVELFAVPIPYQDTTTVPIGTATVIFDATGSQPLNIARWRSIVRERLAGVKIEVTLPSDHGEGKRGQKVSVPLSHVLAFDWSFYPYQFAYVDTTRPNLVLKSVVLKTRNKTRFTVRLTGPWQLLQFFGKPVTSMLSLPPGGAMPMPMSMQFPRDKSTALESPRSFEEHQLRSNSLIPSHGQSLVATLSTMPIDAPPSIQKCYPNYATRDPNVMVPLLTMDAQAELLIDPKSTYLGPIDGLINDALMIFSVVCESSEQWVYHNMDNQDSHALHFHLTSGFVQAPWKDQNTSLGLVSAHRSWAPFLYSRETYGIGPQQKLGFCLRFPNYSSPEAADQPGVPGLGYMVHCHHPGATHADMGLMNQYYVLRDKQQYKKLLGSPR